jgi:S-adenosylmethionine uptake transporter
MPLKHSHFLPIALALAGVFLFSVMDAVMKAQALAMGTFSAMFWRNAMGALFAATLYLPFQPTKPSKAAFKLHLGRSALTAVMMYLFFFGLTRIPLAQAIGLTFIAPIIALFLAAPFLGERIGPNVKLAALLGFVGVMVVVGGDLLSINASTDLLGVTAVVAFSIMYAINLILQRKLALIAKPKEITFYQNTFVLLLMIPFAPLLLLMPANELQWGGAIVAGLVAIGSLILISTAYRRAEAQQLITTEYTAFIWAALFGWWIFGETVSPQTLVGTGLIMLGCIVSARKATPRFGHTPTEEPTP